MEFPAGGSENGQVVAAGNWVSLRYRLHDSQGEAIEEQPRQLVYLHGVQAELFPKIEQALEGLRPGACISLYLEPQDSFGDYDASRVHLVDRQSLPADLEEGMAFEGLPGRVLEANTAPKAPDAAHDLIYTVTDLSADVAVLDGNHPLAGMSLRFDIEVMEIWEATQDEIEQALTAPQA
jgi:FKBP-type peptidyl-prolyl cis-trans isomerase SlyD